MSASKTAPVKRPTFFATPAQFRAWLARHHATGKELLVGFYKTGSGKPSMTWRQSVDEALCFGSKLTASQEKTLSANRKAAAFFHAQPPWHQRTAIHWVISAKREETRARRLGQLIADSAAGKRIGLAGASGARTRVTRVAG